MGLGAYAKVLSDMYPELEVSLFPGGANANVLRVAKGASQIGATMLPNMKAAVDGLDPYKTPIKDIAALANIQDITRLHFVAPADSPVTSLREIAEKRIPVRLGTGVVGGNARAFCPLGSGRIRHNQGEHQGMGRQRLSPENLGSPGHARGKPA